LVGLWAGPLLGLLVGDSCIWRFLYAGEKLADLLLRSQIGKNKYSVDESLGSFCRPDHPLGKICLGLISRAGPLFLAVWWSHVSVQCSKFVHDHVVMMPAINSRRWECERFGALALRVQNGWCRILFWSVHDGAGFAMMMALETFVGNTGCCDGVLSLITFFTFIRDILLLFVPQENTAPARDRGAAAASSAPPLVASRLLCPFHTGTPLPVHQRLQLIPPSTTSIIHGCGRRRSSHRSTTRRNALIVHALRY